MDAVNDAIDQARTDGTLAALEHVDGGFAMAMCDDLTTCCRCGSGDGVEGYQLVIAQGRGCLALALTMCSACAVRAEIEREEIEHG